MRFAKILAATAALVVAAMTNPAAAEDVIRLGLPVAGNAFHASLAAAEELGYYKDANLKVEVTTYRGGSAAQEALNADAADVIGYFGAGAALAISKGANSRIVFALSDKPSGWYIITTSASGIKSMKDMDGKKAGIAAVGGTGDMIMLWAAEQAGVKVQLVPLGGGAMLPGLQAGQVDAIPMFPGMSLKLIESGEAVSLVNLGRDMEPTHPDVLVASGDMVNAKEDVLRRFLEATSKALAHMQQDRAFGLKFLKSYTGEQDDKINELTYEQVTLQQPAGGRIVEEYLGNSVRIAGKAWGLADLQAVRPADVYVDILGNAK